MGHFFFGHSFSLSEASPDAFENALNPRVFTKACHPSLEGYRRIAGLGLRSTTAPVALRDDGTGRPPWAYLVNCCSCCTSAASTAPASFAFSPRRRCVAGGTPAEPPCVPEVDRVTCCGCRTCRLNLGSSLFSVEWGEQRPLPPAHTSIAPPEPPRSLIVVPRIPNQRYYGDTMVRLRGGPRDGLVQGWRNRGPEARLFGVPSWVRRGRRDAGKRAKGQSRGTR